VQLNVHAQDDASGSGVKEYDLYVSRDSGSYEPLRTHSRDSVIGFTGIVGAAYRFYSLATDNVGNREGFKSTPDATVIFVTNRRWYVDSDNDGFGNIFHFLMASAKPIGYVADSSDCVSIGCTEICPSSTIILTSNISGSSYQWQLNSGSGFANINDNSDYAGTHSANLQLLNAPSSWYGYDYRCVVNGTAYSMVFSLKFSNSWLGNVSTAWENPANWGCGNIPDANTDVVIAEGANSPVVNSNQSCRSLKLSPGKNVIINPNYHLILTGLPQ
jgi:hypothetical protein